MIPFKELQNLADKIRTKMGLYCSVSVEHNAYTHGYSELCYSFYIGGKTHKRFNTVQELKYAMKQIINPKPDKGVSVKED